MKHKLFTVLGLVTLVILAATPVMAGNLRMSKVAFSMGVVPSLIAGGMLYGLGTEDVFVVLDATGIPAVTCINKAGSEVPGQNTNNISVSGQVLSSGSSEVLANGSRAFVVEAASPELLTGVEAVKYGCPGTTWAARFDFVNWTSAGIRVLEAQSGAVLVAQHYSCTTDMVSEAVACTPVP